MTYSDQCIQWQFGEDSNLGDSAQSPDNDGSISEIDLSESSRGGRATLSFELLLGLTAMYTIALFLLWQWAERRFTQYDSQLMEIQAEVEQAQSKIFTESFSQYAEEDVLREPTPSYRLEMQYLAIEVSEQTLHLMTSSKPEVTDGDDGSDLLESIASTANSKYKQLHIDFGLSLPCQTNKLTIAVGPPDTYTSSTNRQELIFPFEVNAGEGSKEAEVELLLHAITSKLLEHVRAKLFDSGLREQC